MVKTRRQTSEEESDISENENTILKVKNWRRISDKKLDEIDNEMTKIQTLHQRKTNRPSKIEEKFNRFYLFLNKNVHVLVMLSYLVIATVFPILMLVIGKVKKS